MAPHIVVLGAGYAGLLAAKYVAKQGKADVRVTLINERDRFVERVRLHQLAAGQELREHPLAALLAGTGIRLVVDRAVEIDAARRTVRLAGGQQVGPYDTLIYALGSRADRTAVPGAAEHAYDVSDAEQALRLRDRIPEAGVVAVVGGGLTGLEAATELAETHPGLKVKLVTSGMLGEALSERARRHLARVFARLGIETVDEVRVREVRADGLLLAGGDHVGADTVVWTTGFRVPGLARDAGFEVDGNGRMVVDRTLRSVSHDAVYGVGDAAAARLGSGQELRMSCATGMPSAQVAAKAVLARMAGRPGKPLRFRYFNQNISLGRRDGLIQFVRADDSPVERVLTGRKAFWYKEIIVRGAVLVQRNPGMPTSF